MPSTAPGPRLSPLRLEPPRPWCSSDPAVAHRKQAASSCTPGASSPSDALRFSIYPRCVLEGALLM